MPSPSSPSNAKKPISNANSARNIWPTRRECAAGSDVHMEPILTPYEVTHGRRLLSRSSRCEVIGERIEAAGPATLHAGLGIAEDLPLFIRCVDGLPAERQARLC